MESEYKNYYDILEIPENSSQEEIHKSYMRAKNAYNHDSLALYSLMTKEECENILEVVEEAYTILSDPSKRSQYDQARGINVDSSNRVYTKEKSSGYNEEEHSFKKSHHEITSSSSMSKIVARNRFSLDYKVDSEFEKEIEQATNFTGEFLKKIREYKNVDLPRLADMTKVSKTYIHYIEEEAFEKLPAPVYVRGFVYQYAKSLKLNPDMVANSYLFRLKQSRTKAV